MLWAKTIHKLIISKKKLIVVLMLFSAAVYQLMTAVLSRNPGLVLRRSTGPFSFQSGVERYENAGRWNGQTLLKFRRQ